MIWAKPSSSDLLSTKRFSWMAGNGLVAFELELPLSPFWADLVPQLFWCVFQSAFWQLRSNSGWFDICAALQGNGKLWLLLLAGGAWSFIGNCSGKYFSSFAGYDWSPTYLLPVEAMIYSHNSISEISRYM
jgi:hypothetical protein